MPSVEPIARMFGCLHLACLHFARLALRYDKATTMNAILLTVFALSGADASAMYGGEPIGGYVDGCDPCAEGGGRHGHHHGRGGYLGPMPQSCYNPSFGCYPSTRFMNRYPAFHGTYYRAAYNY